MGKLSHLISQVFLKLNYYAFSLYRFSALDTRIAQAQVSSAKQDNNSSSLANNLIKIMCCNLHGVSYTDEKSVVKRFLTDLSALSRIVKSVPFSVEHSLAVKPFYD
jgi:negative regulator of replication initiation